MELGHKQIPGYCQVNGMAQSPSQPFFWDITSQKSAAKEATNGTAGTDQRSELT